MKHLKCLTSLRKKVKYFKISSDRRKFMVFYFVYTGKTVSLETQNNLLELLSYTGLGNETASDLSQFNEQQRMINEKDTLEFSCRGDMLNQSLA